MDTIMEDPDGHWACPQCTLINLAGAQVCAVCDLPFTRIPSDSASARCVINLVEDDGGTGGGVEPELQIAIEQVSSEPTLKVLLALVGNAADHPDVPKYRGPVRKTNDRIRTLIVEVPGAAEILRRAGFEEDVEGFILHAPNVERLNRVRRLLQARERIVAGSRLVRSASGEKRAAPAPEEAQGATAANSTSSGAAGGSASSRFPPIKRRRPKYDENLLREVRADIRYNADLRGAGASSSSSSSSSGDGGVQLRQTMMTDDVEIIASGGRNQAARRPDVLRLRIRLPLGGQMDLEVATYMRNMWQNSGFLLLEGMGIPP